jgi:hypothetical protein
MRHGWDDGSGVVGGAGGKVLVSMPGAARPAPFYSVCAASAPKALRLAQVRGAEHSQTLPSAIPARICLLVQLPCVPVHVLRPPRPKRLICWSTTYTRLLYRGPQYPFRLHSTSSPFSLSNIISILLFFAALDISGKCLCSC